MSEDAPANANAATADSDMAPATRGWVRPLLLWVVPGLAIAVAAWFWFAAQRYATTDNAYVKAERSTVAAEVDGRVQRVVVRENARVAKGDVLLEFDDEGLRYAVDQARARVDMVSVQLAGLAAEYGQKRAALELARRTAQFAQREMKRQQELAAQHLVSLSKLDSAAQMASEAAGQVVVAERDVAAVAAKLGGRLDLPVSQHAEARSAQAELARAKLDLRHAQLTAPRDGIVGKLPQVGDHLVRGAPALSIISDSKLWIEANFKETDLRRVRVGQPVEVRIDTYGSQIWRGTLAGIAQATGSEFAILPAQNASGNWVKVVQRIPVRIELEMGPNDPPLRMGMSASVKVDTEPSPLARSANAAVVAP